MREKVCRHQWRYEETVPGCYTRRICIKCGESQTWGYHNFLKLFGDFLGETEDTPWISRGFL